MESKIVIIKDIEDTAQKKYKNLENQWALSMEQKPSLLKRMLLSKSIMILKFCKLHYSMLKKIGLYQTKINFLSVEKLLKYFILL